MPDRPALTALLPLVVLLATVTVAYIAVRRSRPLLPAALLLGGLGLGAVAHRFGVLSAVAAFHIAPELALDVLLPVLLFRTAFAIDTPLLARNIRPVLAVGLGGALLAVPAVGLPLAGAAELPLPVALLAAALLAAAGTPEVHTLFRDLGVPRRVMTVARGEELFRQATTVVLAAVLLAGLRGAGRPTPAADALAGGANGPALERLLLGDAGALIVSLAGALIAGMLIGWLFGRLVHRLERERALAVLLTAAAAYSAVVASLLLDVNGVVAAAGAGLALGGAGRARFEPATLHAVSEFWTFLAIAVEAVVLVGVGLLLPDGALPPLLGTIAAAAGLWLLARAATVFGLFHLHERFFGGNPAELRHQALLAWGTMDGPVALLLVLALPVDFAYREILLGLVVGTALIGAIVQAPTLGMLARALGLGRANPSDQYVRDTSLLAAKQRARERLPQLRHGGMVGDRLIGRLDEEYAREEAAARERLESLRERGLLEREEELTLLKRRFLLLEKQVYLDLFQNGQVSERVARDLQHSVNVQVDALRSPAGLPAWSALSPRRGRAETAFLDLLDRVVPESAALRRRRLQRIAELYETFRARVVASDRVLGAIDAAALEEGSADGLLQVRALFQLWNSNGRQSLDRIADRFPEYASRSQQLLANRFCLRAEEQVLDELEALEVLPQGQARALRNGVERRRDTGPAGSIDALDATPVELLHRVPLFGGLPETELARIAELLRPRAFGADEVIVAEDAPADSLFLLARGVARVLRHGDGGGDEAVATLVAGDFFGETAVLAAGRRKATIRAVTPATLYELRQQDLLVLGLANPPVPAVLERTFADRVD